MIKLFLVGNVSVEPRMSSTTAGMQVCSFGAVCDLTYKKKDDPEKKNTFFMLTAFGNLAVTCGRFLTKGRKVAIVAKDLTYELYEGKDGKTKVSLRAVADDVEFMGGRAETEDAVVERDQRREAAAAPMQQMPEGFIEVDENELPF